MSLYLVASAKGAPGVTTTAAALAATWHGEAVLADLDPAGGDVALRYRDPAGGPLDTNAACSPSVPRSAGPRRRRTSPTLQTIGGGMRVLAGVASPEQVGGLVPAWPHLTAALSELPGHDVIGDLGRLGVDGTASSLLLGADGVLLLTRPGLEDVAHVRERLRALVGPLHLRAAGGVPVTVGVVTSDRDRHSARDLQRLLQDSGVPVPRAVRIADDPKSGPRPAPLHHRPGGPRRMLLRSVRAVGERLRELAASRRSVLGAVG